MAELILGLVLFLGVHALRVFAEGTRQKLIGAMGPFVYKAFYSIVSIIGLLLIVSGYSAARIEPIVLYTPPTGVAHAASLLTLIAFVLLIAAYIPGNLILRKLKHPMTLAVKVWAFAHLLSNGTLADVLFFGGFLVWSVLVYRSARRRAPVENPGLSNLPAVIASRPPSMLASLVTLVVGIGAWAWFAFEGHAMLIGVAPFGVM
ncbi:MAG: NnrU family protein [Burkholderiaceae bacterium]